MCLCVLYDGCNVIHGCDRFCCWTASKNVFLIDYDNLDGNNCYNSASEISDTDFSLNNTHVSGYKSYPTI